MLEDTLVFTELFKGDLDFATSRISMILNNGRKFFKQIPDEQFIQLILLIWANTVEISAENEYPERQFIIDELNAHLKVFTDGIDYETPITSEIENEINPLILFKSMSVSEQVWVLFCLVSEIEDLEVSEDTRYEVTKKDLPLLWQFPELMNNLKTKKMDNLTEKIFKETIAIARNCLDFGDEENNLISRLDGGKKLKRGN